MLTTHGSTSWATRANDADNASIAGRALLSDSRLSLSRARLAPRSTAPMAMPTDRQSSATSTETTRRWCVGVIICVEECSSAWLDFFMVLPYNRNRGRVVLPRALEWPGLAIRWHYIKQPEI